MLDNPFAHPTHHPRDDPSYKWENSFKLDLPEFAGNLQPDEFVDWLLAVEEVLDFKQVPADRRVPLVATSFLRTRRRVVAPTEVISRTEREIKDNILGKIHKTPQI